MTEPQDQPASRAGVGAQSFDKVEEWTVRRTSWTWRGRWVISNDGGPVAGLRGPAGETEKLEKKKRGLGLMLEQICLERRQVRLCMRHNMVASTNGQHAGSIVAALEPSDRMLMKNTALSASLDTAASLAFRELLK